MKISFKTKALQRICSNKKAGIRKLGAKMAEKLRQRMMELDAAEVLDDIHALPQARCHELRHQRKGQLSVNLQQPYRLIFVPADNPVPCKKDGGLDWGKIKEIEIIGITDTHTGRKR